MGSNLSDIEDGRLTGLTDAFYSDNKIAITSELSSTEVIKSFITWNVDAISLRHQNGENLFQLNHVDFLN